MTVDTDQLIEFTLKLSALIGAGGVIYKFSLKPVLLFLNRIASLREETSAQTVKLDALADSFSKLTAEFKPNGGGSMKDVVERIEQGVTRSELRNRILSDLVPYAIFETDREGNVVAVNRTLARWSGRDASEMHGDGWLNLLMDADRDRVTREWETAFKRERVFEVHFQIRDQDGKPVTVSLRAVPMHAGDIMLGYVGVMFREG